MANYGAVKIVERLMAGETLNRKDIQEAGIEDIIFLLEVKKKDLNRLLKQLKGF